jgi:hypothetical protein
VSAAATTQDDVVETQIPARLDGLPRSRRHCLIVAGRDRDRLAQTAPR